MPYKDPAKARGAKRRYRERNREQLRAEGREYARARYWSDPERFRAEGRANAARFRAENPDYQRRWYRKNRERELERAKDYREENRDKVLADLRRWYAENRAYALDYARAQGSRRRAEVFGAEGTFTVEEWRALCEAYGYRCAYCGDRADPLCTDHVVPISRRGANTIENIVPACISCNARKGTKTAEEFLGAEVTR